MSKINRFFWHCSGADISLLEKCPTESSKYAGIGATIFFTGIFALLAGAYAIHTVFQNYWISAAFGILWGLMIFNLDRYILSSMRKEGKWKREFISAIPRLVLAVLISIVIAKPLELKIFEKEIDPEIEIMKQEKRLAQEQHVKLRFQPSQEARKTEISLLKTEILNKEAERNHLVQLAQEEADGTGGSKRRNLGPIYKVKKQDADRVEAELGAIRERNAIKIASLEAAIVEGDLAMNAALASELSTITGGLAARLEAMDRLVGKSNAIWLANLFVILLFMIVECAPVMVKLISAKGPYDNMLRIEEHRFATSEAEAVATTSAEVRRGAESVPQQESVYLSGRLDAELK